jgi:hypothetical protein
MNISRGSDSTNRAVLADLNTSSSDFVGGMTHGQLALEPGRRTLLRSHMQCGAFAIEGTGPDVGSPCTSSGGNGARSGALMRVAWICGGVEVAALAEGAPSAHAATQARSSRIPMDRDPYGPAYTVQPLHQALGLRGSTYVYVARRRRGADRARVPT